MDMLGNMTEWLLQGKERLAVDMFRVSGVRGGWGVGVWRWVHELYEAVWTCQARRSWLWRCYRCVEGVGPAGISLLCRMLPVAS